MRSRPALPSGWIQRSRTSSGTTNATTASTTNTARLPTSRVFGGAWRIRPTIRPIAETPTATRIASSKGTLPTSTQ
jgi:hypothetical protein